MYVLYVASFRWLAAWVVALLTIFTPLYVMLLAGGLTGARRARSLAAVALAIGGAALVTVARRRAAVSAGPASCCCRGRTSASPRGSCDSARCGGARARPMPAWWPGCTSAPRPSPWRAAGGAALGDVPLRRLDAARAAGPAVPGPAADGAGLLPVEPRRGAHDGRRLLAVANNLKVPLAVLVSWLVFGESGGRRPRAAAAWSCWRAPPAGRGNRRRATAAPCPLVGQPVARGAPPRPSAAPQEGLAVGGLLDQLRGRLARAVAGLGLDADQHRLVARLRGLQRGRELEAVAGHDAVVVVGGRDQRRRVAGARLEVVVGASRRSSAVNCSGSSAQP